MKCNKKAFFIEDDEIAKSVIKNVLKLNKNVNQSDFCSNGLVALEKLKAIIYENEKLPSFILLDFNMPVMNGLEFI